VRVKDRSFVDSVDLILDNPPYTDQEIKESVLRDLVATGKPWCMLLPSSILQAAFLRELVDMDKIQVIYPRKVYVSKTGQAEVPFKYLVWLCYKTKMQRDIAFM
jgi:hypothetical protein